jgi:cation diffusion facilitator CzcD-associated flavoprotein CzcO
MMHPAAAVRPAGRLQDVTCCADKSGAVIVGGGPVGLAAALMLSRRGWKDITVVEQQSSVTYVNPDRSYGEAPALPVCTASVCCEACAPGLAAIAPAACSGSATYPLP